MGGKQQVAKRTQLGHLDGQPFIAKLEQAVEQGDADFIERNMPRLEKLIARLQDRAYELAPLQARAREAREQHEPSADTWAKIRKKQKRT